MNATALFLAQVALIISFSRLVAFLFHRFGQPRVVGEMAAGIALGPTLFGLLAPNVYRMVFPAESLTLLTALSQIGIVIFTYLVGVRVDFGELRRQKGVAIVTSNISVILPLGMGFVLAQYLYPRYGAGDRPGFSLFVGTAMSVTAFPVLARILTERNLLGTRLGSVAIACAAVDDLTAWVLLAAIVSMTKHGAAGLPWWGMVALTGIYVVVMIWLKRVLAAWTRRFGDGELTADRMLVFVTLALASGAAGEALGVHALIGAFAAGLITPRECRQHLTDKLEPVMLMLFIPIFFTLTGIRTSLFLAGGGYFDLLLILAVAVASKWGGATIGARIQGMSWRDASQLGLMMNTRGLVELIVLNVGLDAGILTPPLFSMMVMMALVTTFMATPLMDWGRTERPAAKAA